MKRLTIGPVVLSTSNNASSLTTRTKEALTRQAPARYQWYLDDEPITYEEYKIYKLLHGDKDTDG